MALAGCDSPPRATVEIDASREIEVTPRNHELRTFPCVEQCHAERTPNPTKRPLQEFHTQRNIRHSGSMFWCTFCHDPDNLDTLHLLDGTPVSFDEPQRVCGQCHGAKIRDWNMGIHGLQTGSWLGTSVRRACPVCHDPHDPHRPKFQALPPPKQGRQETSHE